MSTPTPITACVNFDNPLQAWDGFGCNYVEVSHTLEGKCEDYGSFSEMADQDIETILSMIFGPDGLCTHIIKAVPQNLLCD
jgi:hypothetical protein